MSEDSKVGISCKGSSVRICLIAVSQGCCGSGQYNLFGRILRCDTNTSLKKSYEVFISLLNMTYQGVDQYLEWSIVGISFFSFWSLLFNFFRVVLVSFIKRDFYAFLLDQFLVISFSDLLLFLESLLFVMFFSLF